MKKIEILNSDQSKTYMSPSFYDQVQPTDLKSTSVINVDKIPNFILSGHKSSMKLTPS